MLSVVKLWAICMLILVGCVVAAVGVSGRRRCDDIKAQLDVASDQIKQAERAQHEHQHEPAAAAHPTSSSAEQKHASSRASSRSVSPEALNYPSESPARQLDDLKTKVPSGQQEKKRKRSPRSLPNPETEPRSREEQERKRYRAAGREGSSKKSTKEVPIEKAPGGKHRKHTAGDISADPARGRHRPGSEEVEAAQKEGSQAVGIVNELPQLKKKRHLLYKQLQEARQQVICAFVTVFSSFGRDFATNSHCNGCRCSGWSCIVWRQQQCGKLCFSACAQCITGFSGIMGALLQCGKGGIPL